MALSYYIYYKVPPQTAARLQPVVQELQRSVAARTSVHGRLLCRGDKAETWMEIYEHIVDAPGFEAVLSAELERLRFSDLLGADSRRTEVFRPL